MRKVFLILLCFIQTFAHGQAINPYFKRIGIDNGLPHHKVNRVLQDRRGFLWFGTEDGLSRYDGQHFTIYRHRPNDSTTISGNIIADLYQDNEGILWIATRDGGISSYDYKLSTDHNFKQYPFNSKDSNDTSSYGINNIAEDRFGYLWLATNKALLRFNKRSGRFSIPIKQEPQNIGALTMGVGDTLLAGSTSGVLKINTRTLSYQNVTQHDDQHNQSPTGYIAGIFKDYNNETWVGTLNKVVYKVSNKGICSVINPNADEEGFKQDNFVAFAEDQSHNIWMAGESTGIAVLNASTGKFQHFRHNLFDVGSLSDDRVNSIYVDRNNNVWIATDNGVNLYVQLFSKFTQQTLPSYFSDARINDFYKDSANSLWLGTSEGIFIKENKSNSFKHLNLFYNGKKLSVTKFFADSADGSFYLGTNYSLFKYNRSNNELKLLPNTDKDPVMRRLVESHIVSIVRDTINDHPVLIVSPYGLKVAYYDLADKKWLSREEPTHNKTITYNIKQNLIRKLFKDKNNDIWLATNGSGLGVWEPESNRSKYFVSNRLDSFSLTSNDVFDVIQTRNGNFWISTYGGGVNFLKKDNNRFIHMIESSNITEGIQLDEHENLWIVCNGHFHEYEKSDGIYRCYDLPRLHNTSGLSGYMYKDRQGIIYAAGTNFYVSFNPSSIKRIDNSPHVYFTDIKIYDKSFSQYLQQKQIEINYGDKMFSIEFAAPHYTGDNLRYSYILEGADTNWISAGKNNIAHYTNLKGGTYHFKVKATNWDGTYNNNLSELVIIVKRPFWQSAWFIVLTIFIAITLGYLIYRYRVLELLKQQAIRNEIAKDLHDQVGSTLSSISVYAEVAKRYLKQKEEDSLNSVLDTINETANEMTIEIGDIVWAINPKDDNLVSVINRVNKYAKPLCDAKDIDFVFRYDSRIARIHIDLNLKKNIFLILKESINNAVKHSGCNRLSVEIKLRENTAELVVTDNGQGFVNKQSQNNTYAYVDGGNGLNNIQSRASDFGASVEINSKLNEGTVIKIWFRVKNNGL